MDGVNGSMNLPGCPEDLRDLEWQLQENLESDLKSGGRPSDGIGLGPVVQFPINAGLGQVHQQPGNLPSAKRSLMLNTVVSATSNAWATLVSYQLSPVLSRIQARVITGARLLQAQARYSNRFRS